MPIVIEGVSLKTFGEYASFQEELKNYEQQFIQVVKHDPMALDLEKDPETPPSKRKIIFFVLLHILL
jgi:hypothetical protein